MDRQRALVVPGIMVIVAACRWSIAVEATRISASVVPTPTAVPVGGQVEFRVEDLDASLPSVHLDQMLQSSCLVYTYEWSCGGNGSGVRASLPPGVNAVSVTVTIDPQNSIATYASPVGMVPVTGSATFQCKVASVAVAGVTAGRRGVFVDHSAKLTVTTEPLGYEDLVPRLISSVQCSAISHFGVFLAVNPLAW